MNNFRVENLTLLDNTVFSMMSFLPLIQHPFFVAFSRYIFSKLYIMLVDFFTLNQKEFRGNTAQLQCEVK